MFGQLSWGGACVEATLLEHSLWRHVVGMVRWCGDSEFSRQGV